MRELVSNLATMGLITTQGSDFVIALSVYKDMLDRDPPPAGTKDVLVIISDGGNDPGGFANDVMSLVAKPLAELEGRTKVIAVGFGEDAQSEIPEIAPDGREIGIISRKSENGTPGAPWTSGFDDEMMTLLAGTRGTCIRLAAKATEGGHCQTFGTAQELGGRLVAILRNEMRPLAPHTRTERRDITHIFAGIGIIFLFISLLSERAPRLLPGSREKKMRQVLFETDDAAE
jgi:hypothetical protein